MEWVEVRGKTVEVAVEAALEELGLASAEEADVEILQEPDRGFLGIGGQDAIVRVKPRPKGRGRGRSRRRRGKEKGDGPGQERRPQRQEEVRQRERKAEKPREERQQRREAKERTVGDIDEQAAVVGEFLEGLLEAMGLDGQVATRVEDEVIYAEVTGGQTEALVGPKGKIMQSVQELARTVIQRRTKAGARLRLDIAGYGERRREALGIYARRLAEKVREEGAELMLEPMNAADRKVVHDAVVEIPGVRTYSEGKEPNRSVVIAPEEEFAGED